MRIERRHPAFEDARGSITDLVQGEAFEHATIITSRAGARRGDHYHAESRQVVYVLSGRLRALAQEPGCEAESAILEAGDVLVNEALERHALEALEESTFLVLTRGPRGGTDYESDTYRLEQPLIAGALA